MKHVEAYKKGYYLPPVVDMSWAMADAPKKAPIWCSVDLRDGNQALVIPMSLQEKIRFYKTLVAMGFKEIEVGFPAASETEYDFLRYLVDHDLIPDDVTVQVLTQAREHIIKKTFEALKGVKSAIVHVYNSTSVAQREQVFHKSKEEIKEIAVNGARLLQRLTEEAHASYRFEYSPESFTGTEPEYALEVCNAVLDVWKPQPDRKVIINLPSTVQMSMPHIFAAQVAYLSQNLSYRDAVVLSVHPHNDRGTGVADAEMAMLAGADRIEGTLFGNGERTGNADIVTIGMNLYALGIDPQLDFSNMPDLVKTYEEVTRMHVSERQPYAGKLVFAAFSGSHQDAIAKGMKIWDEHQHTGKWTVPYLPLDPKDIGREYEADVIRINSQSGKGGIGYILEQNFGLNLPAKMREAMGYATKDVSDHMHKELKPSEIFEIFKKKFEGVTTPFQVTEAHFKQHNGIIAEVTVLQNGVEKKAIASGNGRLDAVSNALKKQFRLDYTLQTYQEHALEKSSSSKAIAYVGINDKDGKDFWGAGVNQDIIVASIDALVTAINNMLNEEAAE